MDGYLNNHPCMSVDQLSSTYLILDFFTVGFPLEDTNICMHIAFTFAFTICRNIV